MSGAVKLLIGLGVVAVLVAVLAVTARLRNAGDGSSEEVAVPSLSRNETCAREVFAEALWIYVSDFSNQSVNDIGNAVGWQNPHTEMAIQLANIMATSGPGDTAADRARTMCTRNSDPILTSAQVSALMGTSPAFDVLSEITLFN